MEIKRPCPKCHKIHTVVVDKEQYNRWIAGENIQRAFPNLSADQREILISGICPKCWEQIFPPDEDDWIPAIYHQS